MLNYEQLEAAAAQAGDTAAQLANGARQNICNIYRNYPGWLLGQGTPFPAQFALRNLYNRMCPLPSEQPTGPPTVPPFSGGQCPGAIYRVYYRIQNSCENAYRDIQNITGPIIGLRKAISFVGSSQSTATYLLHGTGETATAGVFLHSYPTGDGGCNPIDDIIISVQRTDGGNDNCGNPTPSYPYIVPPVNVVNNTFNYTMNGGVVNLPISIIPVYNDFEFNLKPEINVDIGGLEFKFNIDGVDINVRNDIAFPSTNPASPYPDGFNPPPKNPSGKPVGGGGDCPDLDLTPVLVRLDSIDVVLEGIDENVELLLDCDRCDRKPASSSSYARVTYPAAQSRTINLNAKSRWVLINIVQVPANAKVQSGEDNQDVYYAGWSYFRSGDQSLPRLPVHFLTNARETPEGAQQFAFTLAAGYTATVTDVYQTED